MEKSLFEAMEKEAGKLKEITMFSNVKNKPMEFHKIAARLEQITLETGGEEKNQIEKEFCNYLNTARRALFDAAEANDPGIMDEYRKKALNLLKVAARLQ